MHPVKFLFEEIYREHWGIPQSGKERIRHAGDAPGWLRSRFPRRERNRG